MQNQLNNSKVPFVRRAYVIVASFSAMVSCLFLALIILADVRQTYAMMSHAAKEVVIANVELAKQVCSNACRKVFLMQMLCLAPSAAVLSALLSSLWLRSFSKKFCSPTKREILFCLGPAPLVALVVFFWNPHVDFQLPFDPLYWRGAKTEDRGRLVPWLVREFKYQGKTATELRVLLGEPDFERLDPDSSGFLGYKTDRYFALQNCIFFYFDRNGKAFSCQTIGEDPYALISD